MIYSLWSCKTKLVSTKSGKWLLWLSFFWWKRQKLVTKNSSYFLFFRVLPNKSSSVIIWTLVFVNGCNSKKAEASILYGQDISCSTDAYRSNPYILFLIMFYIDYTLIFHWLKSWQLGSIHYLLLIQGQVVIATSKVVQTSLFPGNIFQFLLDDSETFPSQMRYIIFPACSLSTQENLQRSFQ